MCSFNFIFFSGFSRIKNVKTYNSKKYPAQFHVDEQATSFSNQNNAFSVDNDAALLSESENSRMQFVCSYCSKGYSSFLQLKRHVKMHSGFKSYVCDVCSKAFNQSIDLVRHRRIHTGERPYKCNFCDYSAVQESHLIRHLKRKH